VRLDYRGVLTVKRSSVVTDRCSLSVRLFVRSTVVVWWSSAVRQRGLSVGLCPACDSGIVI